MYTKCVYIVLVTGVSPDLPLKQKNSYCYGKKTGIYKMGIHHSCFWSTSRFTFETKKRLLVL